MDIKEQFNDLFKNFNKRKIENLIRKIAGKNTTISFDKSTNCFATNRKHINIGTQLCFIPGISKEQFFINLNGASAHEAAHIRYSNYNIIAEINKAKVTAQQNVKELATLWKKTSDEDEKKKIEDKIRENTYEYLYNIFLFDMHNSYEDAFIEDAVVKDYRQCKLILPGIISLRNQVTKLEDDGYLEMLDNNPDFLKNPTVKKVRAIITDLRHFATVGYRNYPAQYAIVSELFPNELDEMLNLGIYVKLAANNTEDTFAAAKVAMKWLEDDIQKLSDEYFEKYMSELQNSTDDSIDMNSLSDDEIHNLEDEMSISQSKAGSSGCSRQTPPINLSLPDELQNELDEQKNTNNNDSSNSSNSSNSSDANNQNSPDNNSQESDNSQENNSQKTNNSQESDSSEDSNDSQKTDNCGNAHDNDSDNSQNDAEAIHDDSHTTIEDILKNNPVSSSDNEIKKAINDLKKMEMSKNSKEKEKAIGGKGKAPSLSQELGDINALSDMHKGIKINYFPPEYFLGKRCRQLNVSQELKQARHFSNKLKHVLISTTKDKKLVGLNKGRINKKDLRRIVTDEKIFYKKIDGKKNTARICILVDESGSMSGEKSEDAYKAASMLVEACRRIRIPVAVFGHNCWRGVNIHHYLDYKSDSKYIANLSHIMEAGGCNHDSIPIFQCLTDMARHKKPKETCLFMVISDGAPAGENGYYGKPAEQDITNIVSFFEKTYDIKTIGIGIGDDVYRVPYIYKNCVIVPNTEKLPDELLKILQKEVLK